MLTSISSRLSLIRPLSYSWNPPRYSGNPLEYGTVPEGWPPPSPRNCSSSLCCGTTPSSQGLNTSSTLFRSAEFVTWDCEQWEGFFWWGMITLPSYPILPLFTVPSPFLCLPVLFLRCNLIKLQAGIIKIFLFYISYLIKKFCLTFR